MVLFYVTFFVGALMIYKGTILLWRPSFVEQSRRVFLRSKMATVIMFGGASVWFLYKIAHLGKADFGDYRVWLLLLFGAIAIGAFLHVRDFLAVRGWCILVLMLAQWVLEVAYMQQPSGRLFLVGFTYAMIVLALYIGVVPYRMRDLVDWMFAKKQRYQAIAWGTILYGLVLVGTAYTY